MWKYIKTEALMVCFKCDDKFKQITELIRVLKVCKNGLYFMLSIADGDLGKDNKDESNSIDNQRTLLVNFVQDRDDLSDEYIEYVDDGYSGTNFERLRLSV